MLKYICLISVVSDLSHYLARFSKEASSGASSRSVPFLNTKNLALNAYLLYGRHTCVEPIYIVTNYEHQFESSAADVGYWISMLSPCTVALKLAGHLATEHESSFEKNINSRYQYLSPLTKTSPSLSFQSLIRLIRKPRKSAAEGPVPHLQRPGLQSQSIWQVLGGIHVPHMEPHGGPPIPAHRCLPALPIDGR